MGARACSCHQGTPSLEPRLRSQPDYNTAYSRKENVAELTSCILERELGFTAHTLDLDASYLYRWLRVQRSARSAISKYAADAQKACDYLITRSEAGRAGATS